MPIQVFCFNFLGGAQLMGCSLVQTVLGCKWSRLPNRVEGGVFMGSRGVVGGVPACPLVPLLPGFPYRVLDFPQVIMVTLPVAS